MRELQTKGKSVVLTLLLLLVATLPLSASGVPRSWWSTVENQMDAIGDSLASYPDTTITDALYDSLALYITATGTFGTEKTVDTNIVSGVSATSIVVFTWTAQPDSATVVWITMAADTVFVHTDKAETGGTFNLFIKK